MVMRALFIALFAFFCAGDRFARVYAQEKVTRVTLSQQEQKFLLDQEEKTNGFLKDVFVILILKDVAEIPRTPADWAIVLAQEITLNIIDVPQEKAFNDNLKTIALQQRRKELELFQAGAHPAFPKYKPEHPVFFQELNNILDDTIAERLKKP